MNLRICSELGCDEMHEIENMHGYMIDKKWKKGKEKKMRKKKWMANGWVTTAGGGED
jgi:hypothetical protein